MIARINEFRAADGRAEDLRARLASIIATIADSPGCLDVKLLHGQDDPDDFVIFEVWESVDHHARAASVIPPDLIASTVAMLAGPPNGRFLTVEGV